MLRPALAALAALTTLAAAGCAGGAAEPDVVRLATDRLAYAAGDTVAVTVTNAGAAELEFGLCRYALERRGGGAWEVAVRIPASGLCAGPAVQLAAGGAGTVRVVLPGGLAAGEYRWRLEELGGRPTNAFQVR
jgi:hypothetical protein